MIKLKTAISLAAVVSAPLGAQAQKAKPTQAAQPRAIEAEADVTRGPGAKAKPRGKLRRVKARGGRVAIEHKANVARGAKAKDAKRALIGEDGSRAVEAKADPVRRGGAKARMDKALPKPGR